jgi:hypothetical protein
VLLRENDPSLGEVMSGPPPIPVYHIRRGLINVCFDDITIYHIPTAIVKYLLSVKHKCLRYLR